MSRKQAVQLRDRLATSGVQLKPTPRGFGSERGVPDSVIWVEPTAISVPRLFPILVELEGTFSNVDDFEKFARRTSEEEPYQHHIEFPTLVPLTEAFNLSLVYHVGAVGHRPLRTASSGELTESEFHSALRKWAEENAASFHTDARITILNGTRIVWWQLSFFIYGHLFEIQIPFIIDVGDQFVQDFELYASRIILPAVAVTTDEESSFKSKSKYTTDIRFRRTPEIAPTD